MSTTIVVIITIAATAVVGFLVGYFIRKRKTLQKNEDIIEKSKESDEDRDKVIKDAEKVVKENEKALKKAEEVLNNGSNSSSVGKSGTFS